MHHDKVVVNNNLTHDSVDIHCNKGAVVKLVASKLHVMSNKLLLRTVRLIFLSRPQILTMYIYNATVCKRQTFICFLNLDRMPI